MKKRKMEIEEDELDEWDEGGFEKPAWLDFEKEEEKRRTGEEETKTVVAGRGSEKAGTTNGHEQTRNFPEAAILKSENNDRQSYDLPFDPIPIEQVLGRRSVYELEQSVNGYGRTIYVEEWEETSGKPKVWYEFNKQKILVKSVRGPSGIMHTYLGKTRYL